MKKMLLTALLSLSAAVGAQTTVQVDAPWVRATVPQQKATAAFMRLTADKDARLVEARSPVAGVVEVHTMQMDKDVMKMRAIPHLDLPAGKAVELTPRGYHVMLMDLRQPVKAGETVPVTLVFEDVARQHFTQEVQAPVKAMQGSMEGMQHGNHGQAAGHGMGHKH